LFGLSTIIRFIAREALRKHQHKRPPAPVPSRIPARRNRCKAF
jgi:hypothetical protein